MAQIFSNLFFGLALIGTCAMIAAMLREEWTRIVSILSGEQLKASRATMSPVRVRTRSRARPEPRRPLQPQHYVAA